MGLSLRSSHTNICGVLHTGFMNDSGDVMPNPDLTSALNCSKRRFKNTRLMGRVPLFLLAPRPLVAERHA